MRHGPLICCLLLVAGCGLGRPDVTRLGEASIGAADGPPQAPPGTCWSRDETPAVIETVTEETGRQIQRIVVERREVWFETVCEGAMPPDFIASIQRALAARGLYQGPADGEANAGTRAAIRAFQAPLGLNSSVLSLVAAQELGLAPKAAPA
ncbi:peptidoglycan-binding protein [Tropicimonas sp. IMCC34011]|uniref:peptidoglycan-binding domain-containing protein n=1 Tax=Tropicimonas sp. IMCC34011 TaxID=2248759 RepID=UPI000E24A579|nr:peptidoglycan-binding domain-containing protein [Tropicimonas sp. IMCC34011]